MAPVRRLRNLGWISARKFPGVRCSTLNTECRSLLCLITMPGRSWVAGIAIAAKSPSDWVSVNGREAGHATDSATHRTTKGLFYTEMDWLKTESVGWNSTGKPDWSHL